MAVKLWRLFVAITLVATFLLSLGALFAFYFANRAGKQAKAYLSDVFQLQVGKSRLADFNRIRETYASNLMAAPPCRATQCLASFHFTNNWLAHLHLARPADLYSSLTFSNGVLESVHIAGLCYGSNGEQFGVSVGESLPNPVFTESFRVGGTQASGKQDTIVVRLTPAASFAQRERAYAFNPAYLVRLGACNDASDMLPAFPLAPR